MVHYGPADLATKVAAAPAAGTSGAASAPPAACPAAPAVGPAGGEAGQDVLGSWATLDCRQEAAASVGVTVEALVAWLPPLTAHALLLPVRGPPGGLCPALAVAAWAVWFGLASPDSCSGRVPGIQSSVRGELYAATRAALLRTGPLLIVTDCLYVHRGLQRLAGRAAAPDALHGDLWCALWAAGGGGAVTSR